MDRAMALTTERFTGMPVISTGGPLRQLFAPSTD